MQKLNSYSKEQLEYIIKIYINNPIIDIINSIYLYENGFKDDEKLIKYDGSDNKVIYIYIENEEKVAYYKFSKERIVDNENKKHNIEDIKNKFYEATNIRVKMNEDLDFLKKDSFIKDKVLYISNMVSEEKQCSIIINEYIDVISKDFNSIGIQLLCKEMIDFYYSKKDIKLPQVIVDSYEINRYYIIAVSMSLFYETIKTFDKKFIKLNHLIKIDLTEDITKLDILNEYYGIEIISKIKEDLLNNNLTEYPYCYI